MSFQLFNFAHLVVTHNLQFKHLVLQVDKSQEHIKAYLGLPATRLDMERRGSGDRRLSSSRDNVQHKGLSLSSRENLVISTVVCSTKLTQNGKSKGIIRE